MKAFILWILSAWLPLAQADACPALVNAAYAAAALECAEVAPGETCYGNRPLNVTALASGNFTRPGHRISGVQSLESGAMNTAVGEWGLAVLNIPANAPGQEVTMVVIGALTLENASTQQTPVRTLPARVTFAAGANLRAEPGEDSELIAALLAGQTVPAVGKLADGSWFRLLLEDGRSGWVRADLIAVPDEPGWLPAIVPGDLVPESLYNPLMAFNFDTGVDDAPCSAAPESGLLLQTTQPVSLLINGVDVQMDGTLYVQSPRELVINVLEGTAQVTSGGETQTTDAGNRIRVRYDPAGDSWTTPRSPEPYYYARMQVLPFDVLPREIAAPEFNLLGVVTPAAPGQPLLGGITENSACTVAALNEVRLRLGPGREYPIQGALYASETAHADAQAMGSDGFIWWRLGGLVWVRDDIILDAGSCDDLPVVDPPPLPTETP